MLKSKFGYLHFDRIDRKSTEKKKNSLKKNCDIYLYS